MSKNKSAKSSKPVNKNARKNNKSNIYKSPNKEITKNSKETRKVSYNLSISIITSTNKPEYMDNIFNNYQRQDYKNKELIIILNNNNMDISIWKETANKYENIRVFQIDEKKDLSDCINFGVSQSSSELIAKFDDDDYYGPSYLKEAVEAIISTKAGVVGKSKYYAYFEYVERIGMRKSGVENKYTNYIHGPTLVMKRNIIKKFKFKNMDHGADQRFLKDCIKNGIKIYSTSIKNFIYIRHSSLKYHTWKIKNENFIRQFRLLPRIKNYEKYGN